MASAYNEIISCKVWLNGFVKAVLMFSSAHRLTHARAQIAFDNFQNNAVVRLFNITWQHRS
jgi:hypothetical protein